MLLSVAPLAERRMRQWAIGLEVEQRLQHEEAAKPLPESVHPSLTISRDTGAGAGELAPQVGRTLGWDVLGRELLDYMAKQYHVPKAFAQYHPSTCRKEGKESVKRQSTLAATGTGTHITSKNVTPDVFCEPHADQVSTMTGQSQAWVDGMLIHRQGEQPDANMTAIGLHRMVKNSEIYRVSAQQGLSPIDNHPHVLDLEFLVKTHQHDTPPDHTTLSAVWDKLAVVQSDTENILGDNVIFQLQSDATDISIPVLEATPERLGYYGATLVEEGVVVRFPNPEYPIWKMELGKTYIDGFIMTPQGKGFYLEYHRDRPHWHQPLTTDSDGYYILAKEVGDAVGNPQYQLTGFRIPYGKAVYTGQGAIHCDAALTGKNWLVGYTDSEDFSTALVRNANGALVKLSGRDR